MMESSERSHIGLSPRWHRLIVLAVLVGLTLLSVYGPLYLMRYLYYQKGYGRIPVETAMPVLTISILSALILYTLLKYIIPVRCPRCGGLARSAFGVLSRYSCRDCRGVFKPSESEPLDVIGTVKSLPGKLFGWFKIPYVIHRILTVLMFFTGFFGGALGPITLFAVLHKKYDREIFVLLGIVSFFGGAIGGVFLVRFIMSRLPIWCRRCGGRAYYESGEMNNLTCSDCGVDPVAWAREQRKKRKKRKKSRVRRAGGRALRAIFIVLVSFVFIFMFSVLVGISSPFFFGLFIGIFFIAAAVNFVWIVYKRITSSEKPGLGDGYIEGLISLGIIAAVVAPVRAVIMGLFSVGFMGGMGNVSYGFRWWDIPPFEIFLGLCGIYYGLVGVVRGGIWRFRQLEGAVKLETSKVSEAHEGLAEFKGIVRSLDQNNPVVISRKSILFEPENEKTFVKNKFYLEDETGRILVDPGYETVNVRPRFIMMAFSMLGSRPQEIVLTGHIDKPEWKTRESVLKDGDPVYVIGTVEKREGVEDNSEGPEKFVIRPSPEGRAKEKFVDYFIPWRPHVKRSMMELFFISDTNEGWAKWHMFKGMVRTIVWGATLAALSLFLIIGPPTIKYAEKQYAEHLKPLINKDDLRVGFNLEQENIFEGDPINLKFHAPLKPRKDEHYWITIVPDGSPVETKGDWKFVDAGVAAIPLMAPAEPGIYVIRLFARYPTHPFNMVYSHYITVLPVGDVNSQVAEEDQEDLMVTFYVDKHKLATTELLTAHFSNPLAPREGEQYWIAIVPEGESDTSYLWYQYLPNGAVDVALKTPETPGKYEIRLHARYSTHAYNVIHRVGLEVVPADASQAEAPIDADKDLEVTFKLNKSEITTLDKSVATFDRPLLPRPNEKYWIAVSNSGSSDSSYTWWVYAEAGVTEVELKFSKNPGEYEVRLYARYPTESYKIIHREKLKVVAPGPEQAEEVPEK